KGVTHWPVCPRQIPLRRALRGLAPRLKIAVLAPKSRTRPDDARNRCLTISQGALLKRTKREHSKSERAVTAPPEFKSLMLRHFSPQLNCLRGIFVYLEGRRDMPVFTLIGGVNGVGKSCLSGALSGCSPLLGMVVDPDRIIAQHGGDEYAGGQAA